MARKPTVSPPTIDGETSIDLLPLSQWLNASLRSQRPLPRRAYTGERLRHFCETLGILSFQGIVQEITCLECDVPHPAIVNYDGGQYFYRCLFNGEIELSSDDVSLFAIDRNAILDVLAAAAKLVTRGRMSYAEDRLVRLGLVADKDRDWMLAYADDLTSPNVFAGVQEAIEKQFPDGPGLIVTPSRVHLNLPLPRNYYLISLHELFFGQEDHFVLNWDAASHRFGRRKKVPGRPGRPSEREIIRGIWETTHGTSDWPSSRADQAETIRSQWPEDLSPPAAGTIGNHIREFERQGVSKAKRN